jgi:hypothetical protein
MQRNNNQTMHNALKQTGADPTQAQRRIWLQKALAPPMRSSRVCASACCVVTDRDHVWVSLFYTIKTDSDHHTSPTRTRKWRPSDSESDSLWGPGRRGLRVGDASACNSLGSTRAHP